MKTNNFLWATLATAILTLTGCSSDDNELTVPQLQDKTALLELRLIGNGINTKATGDNLPTQAEENTVKYFTVAIFNSDNTVNTLHTVTENTASATTISCTPATDCTGIVVANAPSDSYFTGVLNKDDFLKKTIALADAQTKDCLPMSGNIKDKNGNTTFTLSAGDNDGITAQLSRLVARVSISSIKTDFDPKGQYSAASYELKNIFVRNAIKEVIPGTGEYSTTKMETPAYLSGNYDSSNGTADYLANAISPAADVKNEHQTNYWFYVLPNEETTHTALVLEGTFKKNADDTGSTIYYPIIINKSQSGTTITGGSGTGTSNIARNTTYSIKATIKSIGIADPMGDINPYFTPTDGKRGGLGIEYYPGCDFRIKPE